MRFQLLGFKILIAIILTSLSAGCFHSTKTASLNTLDGLQALSLDNTGGKTRDSSSAVRGIRIKALKETAMSLGAQGGLAWASKQINSRMKKDRWYLDTIYNFNGMMLDHGVLPPILAEGSNTLNLAGPDTLRIADKNYRILQQARFATAPPNWRNYLWMQYSTPEMPDKILLARNKAEHRVWSQHIHTGWKKGVQQAYSIFHQNLARLKRDYNGMILYRKLLQQKMVSAPFVSKTDLGVTGNGTDMNINDQVLRITAHPELQTNSSRWKAIMVKRRG